MREVLRGYLPVTPVSEDGQLGRMTYATTTWERGSRTGSVRLDPIREWRLRVDQLSDRHVVLLFGADTLAALVRQREQLAAWENEGGALWERGS